MLYNKSIKEHIEKIYQIFNELQYNEINLLLDIEKNQSKIISKINKLQEYNEIDDMNNSIMNKKINQLLEKS